MSSPSPAQTSQRQRALTSWTQMHAQRPRWGGGAHRFLSGPAQPLPLWPGLRGPRPPGKSCTRGYWGPGFSGTAVTEIYAFVLNHMRGLRRGSHYLKWRNGALGAQV